MMVLIISCRRSEHLSCIAFLQISSVALFLSPFASVHPLLETKNTKKVSQTVQQNYDIFHFSKTADPLLLNSKISYTYILSIHF